MQQHPETTFAELERIFPPEVQGSCGVVRTMVYIRAKNYKGPRYFAESDEILVSGDGIPFAVSTQWGKGNLSALIEIARQIGFLVQASSDQVP